MKQLITLLLTLAGSLQLLSLHAGNNNPVTLKKTTCMIYDTIKNPR